MFASTALSLSNHLTTPASAIPEPKPKPIQPSSLSTQTNEATSEPESEPQLRKLKGSPQLNRWSRARATRSSRKLDRQVHRTGTAVEVNRSVNWEERELPESSPAAVGGGEEEADVVGAKAIYMVSDGTGWTAEHSVQAALGQFDHCLVDRACPVNTHLFSGVIMSFYFAFSTLDWIVEIVTCQGWLKLLLVKLASSVCFIRTIKLL
ncbi:hypothetical protein CsSME_00032474 [Camellia sinensis var. sinensis]